MPSAAFPLLTAFSVAPRGRCRHRAKGDVLVESLVCLAIVGLGAVPLATLGTAWLRWGGQHERLSGTLRLAAERAESRDEPWRVIGGDPARAALCDAASASGACVAGERLAVASLPPDALPHAAGGALAVTRIALWVTP